MDPFVEEIYLKELDRQCQYAIGAVDRINGILGSQDLSPPALFREIASLLSHAAAVSRLLWPPRTTQGSRAEIRGGHLRQVLEVTDEHVLRDRRLRDHMEHFDERLDDWAESSKNKMIVDHHVGERASIGGDAIADSEILRLYDPTTNELVFRGEVFDIQAVTAGVEDILGRTARRKVQIARAIVTQQGEGGEPGQG